MNKSYKTLLSLLVLSPTIALAYNGANDTKMTNSDYLIEGSDYQSENKGDAKTFSVIDVQTGVVNISQKFSAFNNIDINRLTVDDYRTIATALNSWTASGGSVIRTSAGVINLSQLQALRNQIKLDRNKVKTNNATFKSKNSGNADGGSTINVTSGAINISQ